MLIYAGMMLAIIVAVFRKPAAAVGVLLCTYGIEQWTQAKSGFFFSNNRLTNYATGVIICAAVCVRLLRRKPTFRPLPPDYWVMTAIYVWYAMAVIWSIMPAEGWAHVSYEWKFVVTFGFLPPLVIYDREDLKAALMMLLALGSAIAVLLLATVTWGYRTIILDSTVLFTAGNLAQGNPLAIATLGGYVALAGFLMNFRGAARVWQIARYAVVGAGFALAVKSGSRGQALAIIIAALVFMPYQRRFRDLRSFIGFAFSLVFFGGILLMVFDALRTSDAGADRWTVDEFVGAYSGGRVATSLTLLSAWVEAGPFAWFFGLGAGGSYKMLDKYPHVVFVEVLGEAGLIGFAILCFMPYYAFRSLSRLWPLVREHDEDRGMVAALGAIFLFEFMLSFKQGAFLGSGIMFALAVMLGRLELFYRSEVQLYEQLDAGGYAMSEADREHEYEVLEDEYGAMQPAGTRA